MNVANLIVGFQHTTDQMLKPIVFETFLNLTVLAQWTIPWHKFIAENHSNKITQRLSPHSDKCCKHKKAKQYMVITKYNSVHSKFKRTFTWVCQREPQIYHLEAEGQQAVPFLSSELSIFIPDSETLHWNPEPRKVVSVIWHPEDCIHQLIIQTDLLMTDGASVLAIRVCGRVWLLIWWPSIMTYGTFERLTFSREVTNIASL